MLGRLEPLPSFLESILGPFLRALGAFLAMSKVAKWCLDIMSPKFGKIGKPASNHRLIHRISNTMPSALLYLYYRLPYLL